MPRGEAREREDRRYENGDCDDPIYSTRRVVRHGRICEERTRHLDQRAKHVAFLACPIRKATSAIPDIRPLPRRTSAFARSR